MDIIEPHLPCVVPLFRALHNYHVELAPDVYHSDGPDEAFLALLEDKVANGARVFAHDAGWGLASYVLAVPVVTKRDAFRSAIRSVQLEHLYVTPVARGRGLGKALVGRVESWVTELGYDGWFVTFHADNPGVEKAYLAMGAQRWKGVCLKRL